MAFKSPRRVLFSDTTTVLAGGAVVASPSLDGGSYTRVSAQAWYGVASAGSLVIQQSIDGTNWDTGDSVAITGGVNQTGGKLVVDLAARYVRAYILNGATPQVAAVRFVVTLIP